MCKFIGKSNERILCKLTKSEILRLYSIVHVAMETTKTSHFTCQSKSFISIFSLAKFQLVSCSLSLAMIWQMTYTHKLPKLCSATLSPVCNKVGLDREHGMFGIKHSIESPSLLPSLKFLSCL